MKSMPIGNKRNNFIQYYCYLLLLALLWSCNTTKYLDEDQALLQKNTLEITSSIENQTTVRNQVEKYYYQKPNSNFIFWPREYFYFKSQEKDKEETSISRWRERQIEEKPVIYDDSLSVRTTEAFERYFNDLGYFEAKVDFQDTVKKKKAYVNYEVDPGPLYTIRSFQYSSGDSSVLALLNAQKDESPFSPGAAIRKDAYNQELLRIAKILNNNGYAKFRPENVGQLELKRSGTKLDATLRIEEDQNLEIIYFGKVYVDPNYNPRVLSLSKQKTTLEHLTYLGDLDSFYVTTEALAQSIVIKPDELYRKSVVDRTYKNLNAMSAFQFVNVRPRQRENSDTIDYIIQLAPQDKKWVLESDSGINFATIGSQRFLIGGTLGLIFTNRNFLRGSEEFNVGVNGFGEFDLRRQDRKFNSLNLNFNSSLKFPRFVDGLGLFSALKNVNLGQKPLWSEESFIKFSERTVSDVSLRYNYNFLVEFWDYHSVNLEYAHGYRPNSNTSIDFVQTGVNVFDPTTFSRADTIFQNNIFLENSFTDRLITGVIFKSLNYQYASNQTPGGFSWGANVFADLSGLEVHMLNLLLSGATEPVSFGKLELAQYAKLSFDLVARKDFFGSQSLAARFGMGVVRPFGTGKFRNANINVPYIAQFVSGGANSVRAWQLRELGPGGFNDPLLDPDLENRTPFYAAGDIRLDFNLEYRFDIWWIFEGALFLDGGNIWTVQDDREEAKFSSDFLNSIALGTGFGVRTDFKYFILRVDLGYKLRNPFPVETSDGGQSHILLNELSDLRLRNANLNLAIGYPF